MLESYTRPSKRWWWVFVNIYQLIFWTNSNFMDFQNHKVCSLKVPFEHL